MRRATWLLTAIAGYAAWGASLYLIATTLDVVFIVAGAAAAGVALPATWGAIRRPPAKLALENA